MGNKVLLLMLAATVQVSVFNASEIKSDTVSNLGASEVTSKAIIASSEATSKEREGSRPVTSDVSEEASEAFQSTETTEANDVVTFEDSTVQDAVCKNLHLAAGCEVTEEQMAGVTNVNLIASFTPVTSLEGLQYATNLQSIQIGMSDFYDLSPLSGLQKLEEITITEGSLLTDISAISTMPALNKVEIDSSRITNQSLEVFEGNQTITDLTLKSNNITDLTAIGSMTNLQQLNVESNSISSLEPLVNVTSLTTLNASKNQLTDITPLGSLGNINYLNVSDNAIATIDAVGTMTSLDTLNVANNKIEDLSPLSNITTLKNLTISKNPNISDLTPVCTNTLTKITASGNGIVGIPNTDQCHQAFANTSGSIDSQKVYETQYIASDQYASGVGITTQFDAFDKSGQPIEPASSSEYSYNREENRLEWHTLADTSEVHQAKYNNSESSDLYIQGTVNYTFKVDNAPELDGVEAVTTVEVLTSFDPLTGVTADDDLDGDLTSEIKVSGDYDLTTIGTYPLTYSVTDSSGHETSAERVINVVDTTKPVISGVNNITITAGTAFNPLKGVKATDNYDGDITKDIYINGLGGLNTKVAGSYNISYVAADSSNNVTKKSRTVTVTAKPDPTTCKWSGTGDKHHDGKRYCKNSNGVILKVEQWTDGNVRKMKYTNGKLDYAWTYNTNNTKIKYEDWNSSGKRIQVNTYKKGKVYGKFYYDKNGVQTKYQKWVNGHRMQQNGYTKGKVHTKFFYDSKGNQTKYEEWSNGHHIQANTYKNGKVYSKFYYNTKGVQTGYEKWSNGHKIQVNTYKNGKVATKTFYDQKGHKTKVETYKNGRCVSTKKY